MSYVLFYLVIYFSRDLVTLLVLHIRCATPLLCDIIAVRISLFSKGVAQQACKVYYIPYIRMHLIKIFYKVSSNYRTFLFMLHMCHLYNENVPTHPLPRPRNPNLVKPTSCITTVLLTTVPTSLKQHLIFAGTD